MRLKIKNFIFLFVLLLMASSCKKETAVSELDTIRKNNNSKSYSAAVKDSAEAISSITKQKLQELLDLSSLYTSGNRDTEIDSVIYAQMQSYFYKPDSTTLQPLLAELDTFNVGNARINELSVTNRIIGKDTIDLAKFKVEYFDENTKSIGIFDREANYILIPSPVKFKKEFKFYFLNFYPKAVKDSTDVGVTK